MNCVWDFYPTCKLTSQPASFMNADNRHKIPGSETNGLYFSSQKQDLRVTFICLSFPCPTRFTGSMMAVCQCNGLLYRRGSLSLGNLCFRVSGNKPALEAETLPYLSKLLSAHNPEKWPRKEGLCLAFLAYPARTPRDHQGPWWLPVLTVTQIKHTQVCWPQVFAPLQYFLTFLCS